MKQRVTIEQLKGLSDRARLRLQKWYYDQRNEGDLVTYAYPAFDQSCKWKPVVFGPGAMQGDPLPLPSIGQMIEFLDEHNRGYESMNIIPLINDIKKDYIDVKPVDDWCDSLWEAVKEVLETENGSDTEET